MRILILGAGAIGGYLGARLAQAGANVTHLVRPQHVESLRAHGLQVESPLGNVQITPQLVTLGQQLPSCDLVMLACKAYALDKACVAVESVVKKEACILPLLNGVVHLRRLDTMFDRSRVMGGVAHMAVTKTPGGAVIRHLNDFHRLFYGVRHQNQEKSCIALEALLSRTIMEHRRVPDIEQAMWEKFVFLATLAGATCALRGSIGEILATDTGRGVITGLLQECVELATLCGHPPAQESLQEYQATLLDPASDYTASMLRDIENGAPVEADHILGYLIERARTFGLLTPHIDFAHAHLQVYQRWRERSHAVNT